MTTTSPTCTAGRPIDMGQAPTLLHDDGSECTHGRVPSLPARLRTLADVLDGLPQPAIVDLGAWGTSVHVDSTDQLDTWSALLRAPVRRSLYEAKPSVHYNVEGQLDGLDLRIVHIDEVEGRAVMRQRRRTASRRDVRVAAQVAA